MNYEEFNQFCSTFTATSHVVQWGGAQVWKVGEKVFAIGGWGDDKQPAFTFKVSDYNFDLLGDLDGYRPAPYFANRGMKWIQQTSTNSDMDDDLKHYISESYRLVASGLSKRKQAELGINLEK